MAAWELNLGALTEKDIGRLIAMNVFILSSKSLHQSLNFFNPILLTVCTFFHVNYILKKINNVCTHREGAREKWCKNYFRKLIYMGTTRRHTRVSARNKTSHSMLKGCGLEEGKAGS